jgi:hypothetical protein
MNQPLEEAAVKRFHYDAHNLLSRHLDDFVLVYNPGRRLKTLRSLTLYDAICKARTAEPKQTPPSR